MSLIKFIFITHTDLERMNLNETSVLTRTDAFGNINVLGNFNWPFSCLVENTK